MSRFIYLARENIVERGALIGRRYLVEDREDTVAQPGGPRNLGHVRTERMASHIRRGHDQVTPWWSAMCLRGHQVTAPSSFRGASDVTAWPTRDQAASRLLAHVHKVDV